MENNGYWRIPVQWMMCGIMEISKRDYPSLDDAVREAVNGAAPLPDGQYLDDSVEVAFDMETVELMQSQADEPA